MSATQPTSTTTEARPMLPVVARIVAFDRERRADFAANGGCGTPPGEMTVQEAASLLGLSVDYIYDEANAGRIEHLRYGVLMRITARGLLHYALSRAKGASEPEVGGSIERLLMRLGSGVLTTIKARIEIILANREGREPPAAALQAYGARTAAPVQPAVQMLRVTEVHEQPELFAEAAAAQ